MKDLHYISIPVRESILDHYIRKCFNSGEAEYVDKVELERKIFGYPKVRRMVDVGVQLANEEVDRDRFAQYSVDWYAEVINQIPVPEELDLYQGEIEPEQGEKGDEEPHQDLKTLIKDFYPQVRDCLDGIMLHFDFDKVAAIMNGIGWKWDVWFDRDGKQHSNEVPSLYAIKEYAYSSLIAAIHSAAGNESAGFEVTLEHKPDMQRPLDFKHQVKFGLRFVAEDCYVV